MFLKYLFKLRLNVFFLEILFQKIIEKVIF